MARIAHVLQIGRATAYRDLAPRPSRYHRRDDDVVFGRIKSVLRDRGSYGYRRTTVLVNREFGTRYNRKRIQRVMRMGGLSLAVRRRVRNRRPHRGRVSMPGSNQRWCSDKMTIVCWNGEIVEIIFAKDCHDREAIAVVAEGRALSGADVRRLMRRAVFARFGAAKPEEPVQWLSDNEGIYTSLETVIAAERLGLVPITTPVASPESNGMAESFVQTLRRDYVDGADLPSAARVLEQVDGWIRDYNEDAPHSALGYRTPAEYRSEMVTPKTEMCLTK
jgi:putative transposase